MILPRRTIRLALACLSFALTTGVFRTNAGVDFSRDVLPILSDACFKCHGPDEKGRKADLRLDTKEGAFRTEDGITVVAPGDLKRSELVLRITSTDRDEMMPPHDANRKLTKAEVSILNQWVAEGAVWGKHWAFEPIAPANQPRQLREIIDEGVASRLANETLAMAPRATAERLLRRVTLDLTGLPPTPTELDAFLQDPSEAAYEAAVDRLLASPRFGERVATEWLDVARFADTHGYQMDRPRAMWPWRDWVINAFNENLPYDRFVTWQLAGDLLPDATKEQRLATAFNRLHMQNEEGGIVEEEYRVAYVVDRVNTFGTAFLGLTLDCARCHDHRYDPITQRDFYALFAFFQNIDEAGQTTFFTNAMPVPTLLLSSDAQDQDLGRLRKEIEAAEVACVGTEKGAERRFTEWLAKRDPSAPFTNPTAIGDYDFSKRDGAAVPNDADPTLPARVVENPTLVQDGAVTGAVLDGENGYTFPGVGRFNRSSPFTIAMHLRAPAAPTARAVVLHYSKAPVDAGSRGYEVLLEDGRIAVGLHHMWPGNALKVRTNQVLAPGKWTRVAVTYDGSSRARGVRVYVDGQESSVEIVRDHLVKDITYGGEGEPDLAIGQRFRDVGFKDGAVARLQVFATALTALEVGALTNSAEQERIANTPVERLPPSERASLFAYYLARVDPASMAARTDLAAARDAERKAVEPIPEAMVMRELSSPKPAYLLERGVYDSHGPEVTADTPGALPAFPAGAPRNRLGLAQWLLDPEHPLTARVTVNRFWQMMFGRGLVETSDNFGLQGTLPSHPTVLDGLARGFIAGGWNVKALLKEIALSHTYRQDSTASPDLFSRDPDNLLLARGPARRLSAEMLRDQALAVSGLLSEKIGGPSVKPYQPAGLWEEIAMGKPKYEPARGPDLYRRSLYTFWKRTVPPPAMVTFDAAERSLCSVRRQSTSTPLQALALLNDVQIVEAARAAAERALKAPGNDAERVRALFRSITSRWPTAPEVEILQRLLAEQRSLFESDEAAARLLLTNGESPADPLLSPAQLAATTVLAQAILNHDEAVMRR